MSLWCLCGASHDCFTSVFRLHAPAFLEGGFALRLQWFFFFSLYHAMKDQVEFSASRGWATYLVKFQILLCVICSYCVYRCEFTPEHGLIAAERLIK